MAKKDLGGRPTIITPEVLQKLEDAFSLGCSDTMACFSANIATSTLYNYQNKNPEFVERKNALKQNLAFRAKKRLSIAIDSDDDKTALDAAKYVWDRAEGKATVKVDLNARLSEMTDEQLMAEIAAMQKDLEL